jgi:ATP-dependent DNA ligase
VNVHDDGKVDCSCESYLYNKDIPTRCTHTDDVRAGKYPKEAAPSDAQIPVSPMLASKPPNGKTLADFPSSDWTLEEKFDGHRLIIRTRAGEMPMAWSRLGNARELPPAIVESLRRDAPTGTFDGELYVPGGTSTDVKALENFSKLVLVLFDVLKVENAISTGLPGVDRRRLLETAGRKFENRSIIHIADRYAPTDENLHMLWNRGGEGGILKRLDAPYEEGKRSKHWIKLKKEGSESLEVIGFEAGLLGPHSRILLRTDDGLIIPVKTLNDAWRADFLLNAHAYIGRRLMISYQEKTRDGRFRHPMAEHFLVEEKA